MRLKAKESTPLTLNMVAFYPGTYTCQLVFSDKEQGEFAIDVVRNPNSIRGYFRVL